MRLSAWTATSTSVLRRSSVRERNPAPITRLNLVWGFRSQADSIIGPLLLRVSWFGLKGAVSSPRPTHHDAPRAGGGQHWPKATARRRAAVLTAASTAPTLPR